MSEKLTVAVETFGSLFVNVIDYARFRSACILIGGDNLFAQGDHTCCFGVGKKPVSQRFPRTRGIKHDAPVQRPCHDDKLSSVVCLHLYVLI
jgi:hypothetical protein